MPGAGINEWKPVFWIRIRSSLLLLGFPPYPDPDTLEKKITNPDPAYASENYAIKLKM
jgi:hypothetical protein